jgi:hypothetical protein
MDESIPASILWALHGFQRNSLQKLVAGSTLEDIDNVVLPSMFYNNKVSAALLRQTLVGLNLEMTTLVHEKYGDLPHLYNEALLLEQP